MFVLGDSINSSYMYIAIEIHYHDHNIAFIAIAVMIINFLLISVYYT